mgnify:CR=1 FL=1
MSVPEAWTQDEIEFHRNESSWCINNMLGELPGYEEGDTRCMCFCAEVEYLREATEDDEERWGVFTINAD